jgi:hypothetical protein
VKACRASPQPPHNQWIVAAMAWPQTLRKSMAATARARHSAATRCGVWRKPCFAETMSRSLRSLRAWTFNPRGSGQLEGRCDAPAAPRAHTPPMRIAKATRTGTETRPARATGRFRASGVSRCFCTCLVRSLRPAVTATAEIASSHALAWQRPAAAGRCGTRWGTAWVGTWNTSLGLWSMGDPADVIPLLYDARCPNSPSPNAESLPVRVRMCTYLVYQRDPPRHSICGAAAAWSFD